MSELVQAVAKALHELDAPSLGPLEATTSWVAYTGRAEVAVRVVLDSLRPEIEAIKLQMPEWSPDVFSINRAQFISGANVALNDVLWLIRRKIEAIDIGG